MFRVGAQRALLRPLAINKASASQLTKHVAHFASKACSGQSSVLCQASKPMGLTAYVNKTALIRSYAAAAAPGTTRLTDLEERLRQSNLETHPDAVSSRTSIHPVFSEVGTENKEDETDMMAGIRHDVKVIKDTFALNTVPKEALNIGLAGVLPYLATSAATVFCAVEINAGAKYGTGYLLNEQTAETLLHVLEPLQVGYGAVILSCLGTIHWGLEWAGYGGKGGYRRYMIGVLTPAVAWPTILLPIEYALITQFLAFNLLYAVDSAATVRGWTPPWYSSYRFILTFVVGASIVVTLIGRGQIQDRIGQMPTASDRFKELQEVGFVQDKKRKAQKGEDQE